jgi:DNA-binding transcriptional LysR family regulator
MEITFRYLEIFSEVAKWKTIKKASENLCLSQSAVSMALSDFEKRLGVRLFDRVGNKLILNNYGEKILYEANTILKKIEEIENIFKTKSLSGFLSIGGTLTIGNYVLPEIVGRFKTAYSDVDIALVIDNTKHIVEKLLNFEIDIAFVEGLVTSNSVNVIPWLEDEIVVFSSPENPLARKEKVTIEELEKANWILREKGSGTRDIFEKAAYDKLKKINIFLEVSQTEAIKHLVESNIGIGALSILTIKRELEKRRLIRLKIPFKIKRELQILLHKKKYLTAILEEFVKYSLNIVKKLN